MKFFVIGLLLLCVLALPGSAGSTEEIEHRIVTLNEGVMETIKDNGDWGVCGNYFAEMETRGKKIIHFVFEKGPPGDLSTVFTFAMIDRIVVSIDKKVAAPMVIVLRNEKDATFFLTMNVEDYKAGLPCLAKRGMKV